MRAKLADSVLKHYPYVSFVIILDGNASFWIDYMVVLLEFLKKFRGFCELIIIDNGIDERIFKMFCFYIRFFSNICSRVKARFLRNTVDPGIVESVRHGLNMSLGEKIIFILPDLKKGNVENLEELLVKNEVFSLSEVYFLSGFPSIDYLENLVSS